MSKNNIVSITRKNRAFRSKALSSGNSHLILLSNNSIYQGVFSFETIRFAALSAAWSLLMPLLFQGTTSAQTQGVCIPKHAQYSPQEYTEIADCMSVSLRDGDQIWWITSRNLCGQLSLPNELISIRYQACDPDCKNWILADTQHFVDEHNSNSDTQTVVYVHGNRTDPTWSLIRGLQVYEELLAQREGQCPVRLVIWHWPADEFPLRVQEFEDNSIRAILHGRHFAKFMQFLNPEIPLRMIGYSLGVQFLLSAAEQTGSFAERGHERAQTWSLAEIRLVALAPVIACNWPSNRQQLARVGLVIDHALAFENKRDVALKAFKAKCNLENLNLVGAAKFFDAFTPYGMQAQYVEVGNLVGREHSIVNYLAPLPIRERISDHLQLR